MHVGRKSGRKNEEELEESIANCDIKAGAREEGRSYKDSQRWQNHLEKEGNHQSWQGREIPRRGS